MGDQSAKKMGDQSAKKISDQSAKKMGDQSAKIPLVLHAKPLVRTIGRIETCNNLLFVLLYP